MTDETRAKFDAETDLLSRVKILLNEAKEPEVLYNRLDQEVETVEDTALIQCFYGTDIARIRATTQAIEFNMQMTRKPNTWVFVEAQKDRSDCVFSWLSRYGVKYIFVKTTDANDGIMLKNPLWNIGAANCTETKMCFLDSDVVMCNSDWVERCAHQLGVNDVISLASHYYRQADDTCTLSESIGHKWVSESKLGGGHCGYTLGMTRKAFKMFGGLDTALILDDIRVFHKLAGESRFKPFSKWTHSFKLDEKMATGYNLSLGYAGNVACHIWHGDDRLKYDSITKLLLEAGVDDMDDIVDYDPRKPDNLPIWRMGKARVTALRNVLLKYAKSDGDMVSEFYAEMRTLRGQPDEKHPLFVCTIVREGFGLGVGDFVKFREQVESKFNPGIDKCSPTTVFFTDCTKFDFKGSGLNVLPMKELGKGKDEITKCANSKEFAKHRCSTLVYVPFDFSGWDKLNMSVWVPDELVKLGNGVGMAVV